MSREATRTRRETTEEAFDDEFADELEEMEYYSRGDAVDVEVVGVERAGEDVEVTFAPPVGDQFTRRWEAPRAPGHETMFTEFLGQAGYNLSTADEIIGDRVPFEYGEDGWEIEVDEPTPPLPERVVDRMRGATFENAAKATAFSGGAVLFPLIAPIILLHALSEDSDLFGAFFITTIGVMIWTLGVLLVLIVLSGA